MYAPFLALRNMKCINILTCNNYIKKKGGRKNRGSVHMTSVMQNQKTLDLNKLLFVGKSTARVYDARI